MKKKDLPDKNRGQGELNIAGDDFFGSRLELDLKIELSGHGAGEVGHIDRG